MVGDGEVGIIEESGRAVDGRLVFARFTSK